MVQHQKNSKSHIPGHGGVVNTVQGNLSQHENSTSSHHNVSSGKKKSDDNNSQDEHNHLVD
jgi:hypothetical protein